MDVRKEYEYGRVKITQTDDGQWWVLLLEAEMGEWLTTAYDRELPGLLHGEHLRSFEQHVATGEERDIIAYWRQHAPAKF